MRNAKYKFLYNGNATDRILALAKGRKYEAAISEFEEYLKKFPYDVSMYLYYTELLISVGELEKAEDKLKNLPVIKKNYHKKDYNTNTKEYLLNYLLQQIKILSFTKRYEECYNLVKKNISALEIYGAGENSSFPLFLRKQLDLITEEDNTKPYYQSYLPRQILSYDEERAIEQIKKCQNSINNIHFSESFPLETIYSYLRQNLPLEDRMNATLFHNHYIMKYNHSGYINGNPVNYLDVVTLNDSNDIIMIRPYKNEERQPHTDLNFMYGEENPKVKRMSQIDKFNQRYGK